MIKKQTIQTTDGTSFHNITVKATVNQLLKVLGNPDDECNDGSDKTNYEWEMETNNGNVFTVYDWKEYRSIGKDENIEWHIGSKNQYTSMVAKDEITKALLNIKWK